MGSKVSNHDYTASLVPTSVNFDNKHVFSIDVEEWFQVGAFENTISRLDWQGLESRVELQTQKLLSVLRETRQTKATFFCLGDVAKRLPHLIKAIADEGHEIACHGSDHKRLFTLAPEEFRSDVLNAKNALEEAAGQAVIGYRAPSFSLTKDTWWAYEILANLGFQYSSSLYPIQHDHYGMSDAPKTPFYPLGNSNKSIVEIPMSVCKIFGRNLPASGGGYFRLLPYFIGKHLFAKAARQNQSASIFYMHPWEVDPNQPLVFDAPLLSRFRHYTGQRGMLDKVKKMLKHYQFGSMEDVVLAPLVRHADGL